MNGLPPITHCRIPVMTVACAHMIMHTHIECSTTTCPVKLQAKTRLIETEHMVPADGPHF